MQRKFYKLVFNNKISVLSSMNTIPSTSKHNLLLIIFSKECSLLEIQHLLHSFVRSNVQVHKQISTFHNSIQGPWIAHTYSLVVTGYTSHNAKFQKNPLSTTAGYQRSGFNRILTRWAPKPHLHLHHERTDFIVVAEYWVGSLEEWGATNNLK